MVGNQDTITERGNLLPLRATPGLVASIWSPER